MPGDKGSAAEWCTHCNAGGHTLQQCEYFANYTRGIAIAMQAIAEHSNPKKIRARKSARERVPGQPTNVVNHPVCSFSNSHIGEIELSPQDVGPFMRFDPLMYLTCANDVYLDKSTASKSPVLPSTNTTNTTSTGK
ncbi:hypothetical protein N7497_010612 [Penicillium chrysogenum]|nr:hypothetical protein N7497_010612 [Penicillium chrysogenum]